MEITQENIDQIKSKFGQIQSKQDLLELMNMTKKLVYGEKSIPFKLQQITYYSSPKISKKRYSNFTIKKKSGQNRTIHAPVKGLKSIQRVLSFILQCVFDPHPAAFGFVRNKSIVDNASLHVGSRYVFNIDLKDFFSSIDQARVWKCLQLQPFNLNERYNLIKEELTPSETFTYYTNIITRHKLWSKNGQKVYLFEYKELNLKNGQQNLTLKIGGNISYEVSKNIDGQSGKIFVIIEKSQLENLKLLAKNNSIENNEDPEITFRAYLYQLTTTHSQKLYENDNRSNLSNIIASLCCAEMDVERKNEVGEWEVVKRNVLPQGAPTSPVITNIICQRLDHLLSGVAKRFGLKYSRYADDITFSSMHNVYQTESEFLKELHRIIEEQNFHIKESKTRLQKDGYRKEVTGLLVNEKANVQQRYIKQLRMWLYTWETYGYEKAHNYFLSDYVSDKGHVKNEKPDMANVIAGKLDYLKMVKGPENELYLKLKHRHKILIDNFKTSNISSETIIDIQKETDEIRITLEAFPLEKKSEKLNTSIIIPKDTIVPSTIIVSNSFEIKNDEKNSLNISYPIYHSPNKTVELLKFFTANEKDLKYSTHSWEEGKYEGYEDYIGKIKSEWESTINPMSSLKYNEALKLQSNRLHAKVSNFLFNNKLGSKNDKGYYIAWGEKNLKFGWSSPELKLHMSHPGNSPFSCPIPENIRELDKKFDLIYFKEYADIFKNEIEFREDSNNFKKMIMELWTTELGYDFIIQGTKDLVGFSFFTDVNYVKDSLRILFGEMFKVKPGFPEIIVERLSNFENKGYHLFRITQKDSYVTREIGDPKFTNPTGNLYSIISNLKNLADYSVVSRFADGKNYRINYLNSRGNIFIEQLSDNHEVLGFTHEFKFYL